MIVSLWQFAVYIVLWSRYIAAHGITYENAKNGLLCPPKKKKEKNISIRCHVWLSPRLPFISLIFPRLRNNFSHACRNFADAPLVCIFEARTVKSMRICLTATQNDDGNLMKMSRAIFPFLQLVFLNFLGLLKCPTVWRDSNLIQFLIAREPAKNLG